MLARVRVDLWLYQCEAMIANLRPLFDGQFCPCMLRYNMLSNTIWKRRMHSLNQALPCLTQPTSNMNTKGRNSISILSWNTARIVLLPWAFGPFFCLLFVGGPPPPPCKVPPLATPPPPRRERVQGKGSEWRSASRRRQLQTRSSHHGVMPKPPPRETVTSMFF